MDKRYDHTQTEKRIYLTWEKRGYFTPKIAPKKKPFVVTLPPPNVTGSLHAGHAMMVIQDAVARFHRMQQTPTLYLPGFDHASIAVEALICKQLAKKKKTKKDVGRTAFLKQAKKFASDSRKYIKSQLKLTGFSLDWSREAYTFDQTRSRAVNEAFIHLFEKGLIYRGERIINWCSKCQTAISDLENEHRDTKGKLYFINYPLVNQSGHITVATTRPETLFADVAVAIHPKNKRFKKYLSQKVHLPLTNRLIPVIADELVDPEFGTGALKITPGHDQLDFEIGQKHGLKSLAAIDFYGRLTKIAGELSGLKVVAGREATIKKLKKAGLLAKTKNHVHALGYCQRCGTITEPLVSKQWFVKIKPLAQKAIQAVKKGQIKILPQRFNKTYFHWLENIRDWCISRQLWWGHRLPVYYCQEMKNQKCKKQNGVFVTRNKPRQCPHCGSKKFKQDEDVLDTWFSSGLWPISVFGWPKKTKDYQYFYPTTLRETGYDILFFWVAREIMMCLEMTGKVPFKTVYLHGLVRDKHGQKFSKSKGIGFDPVDMINIYGADALRMALLVGTTPGNDVRIDQDKIKGYRNYANKVWNIGRFIISQLPEKYDSIPSYSPQIKGLTPKDKRILKKLDSLISKTTKNLVNYRLSPAGEAIYHFLWHEFADKYLEYSKKRIQEGDKVVLSVLRHVYLNCLKLLHPFMPFVTEEIWGLIPRKYQDPLIISSWPK